MIWHNPGRRKYLAATVALALGCQPAFSKPTKLPFAASLPAELATAAKSGQPLLVMVSLDGCPFCKSVRENYLGPMRERGEIMVVQVDMHSRRRVVDPRGVSVSHDELIRSWGIKLAPTVLFFGREGREVAERLVGGSIPDFYGAYLDERVQIARLSLAKLP
jgi:thioredoxin-related protein